MRVLISEGFLPPSCAREERITFDRSTLRYAQNPHVSDVAITDVIIGTSVF